MNRREKLILNTLADVEDPQEARNLDTTLRLVLGDMGEQYCEFWKRRGPGVLFFSPQEKKSLFYKTLKELHEAKEACENWLLNKGKKLDVRIAMAQSKLEELYEDPNIPPEFGTLILTINTELERILTEVL